MLRMAVLTAALAGCTAYQPGSLRQGPGSEAAVSDQHATVGCLDVAIQRRADHDASAVLQYRFGNRCGRPVQVDLAGVTVVARLGDGPEERLAPYDPGGEIHPALLDGRRAGDEVLAYPTPRAASQICVDAATLVSPPPASQWMCFGTLVSEVTP